MQRESLNETREQSREDKGEAGERKRPPPLRAKEKRGHKTDPLSLYIKGVCVERVQSFKFLGTLISADLSWTAHTSAVIK